MYQPLNMKKVWQTVNIHLLLGELVIQHELGLHKRVVMFALSIERVNASQVYQSRRICLLLKLSVLGGQIRRLTPFIAPMDM